MSIVITIIIVVLFISYITYLGYGIFKRFDSSKFPANIFLDGDGRLNFSISKNLEPRLIYFFDKNYSNPGLSNLIPIICKNKDDFMKWKQQFKTCGDVWNWENKQFKLYKNFVTEYINKNEK